MDRKGIVAVTLAIITLVVWTIYNQREMEKIAQARRDAAAAAAIAAPSVVPEASFPAQPSAVVPDVAPAVAAPAVPAVDEKLEQVSTGAIEYSFTNLGGGIARATLLKHASEHNTKIALNELGKIPIGAISTKPGENAREPYSLVPSASAGEIAFERVDARQLKTKKKFTLPSATAQDEYLAYLDVTFSNGSAEPIQVPAYFVHAGATAPIHQADMPTYTGFAWLNGGSFTFRDVNSFATGGLLGMGTTEAPVFLDTTKNPQWLGVVNQYFTSIVTPVGATGNSVWAQRSPVELAAWKAAGRVAEDGKTAIYAADAALGMAGFNLTAGQTVTQRFELYTGPREYNRLQKLGTERVLIMDFGWFGLVSKFLLTAMNWLNAQFHSYAAAIIVLTIFIKLALWPLQNKATNSMKKMQALQPKMTELRDKYKDDPTRMNTELMKLYKDYGVNPFGGCLPILVQIPIFFGFYNMLGKAVELRNSEFLWVNDLSMPDTVAYLPLIGIPLNILPLVMAGTMFWQMAISPKSGDPVQQRVFMFMPLIFVFFCYSFASALALYWTVQNLFSIVQLYITRNQVTPDLQKVTVPVKKKRA